MVAGLGKEKGFRGEWLLAMAACMVVAVGMLVGVTHAESVTTAGGRLIGAGRYAEAEKVFHETSREDVLCAVARSGRGAALLFGGSVDAAEEMFANALVLDPHCVSALLGQGAVRYRQGRIEEAMASYRQALAYDGLLRGQIRASVAQLACTAGFYRTAEIESNTVLVGEPGCELARQVGAASCIAQGRPAAALKILAEPVGATQQAYPGLQVGSPIFAPGTTYYAQHGLDENVRLAGLGGFGLHATAVAAQRVEVGPPEAVADVEEGLQITWPRAGGRVSGVIEVTVNAPGDVGLDYIALLLDNRFVGISSQHPYRIYVDTRLSGDGLKELRCEGYGADGAVAAHASLMVTVVNGARTLMASEVAARADLEAFLQECLVLRADPLLRSQLCGRALMMGGQGTGGRTVEAIGAFEYGFSYNPELPGLRADLLLCYHELGLLSDRPNEIHQLAAGGKRVALTFDDGPHPALTPIILDLLDQYGAKATFLLVGKQAETYPELVRLIVARGHEVGSHSYSHRNMAELSQLEVERELVMTRQIIRRACGRFVTLFRPPGGQYSESVRSAVQSTGFVTLFWNANICDYPTAAPENICQALVERIGQKSIVLLHNGYDATPEVLPCLLPELKRRGYQMGTVSDLSSHKPVAFSNDVTRGGPGWELR